MTLVQLRHLISLAETGSFSRSAERLHLTQPALSRSIRALERELGVTLFDRVGRHSELTATGREMLARARRTVAQAEDMVEHCAATQRGLAGSLRVGLGSGPGAMLMTPLLLRIATQHPALRVSLSRATTTLLVQALRERTLDALVVDARSLQPAADLHCEALGEMRGAFLCRRGHPLLRRRRPLRFADLQAFPIASSPLSEEVARVMMLRYGPEAHPQDCVTVRSEELASLVDVARHSDAVLVAIRGAAPDLVELVLTPPLDASARFGLVTLADRTPTPALPILRELALALLRDPDPDPAP